MGVGYGKGDENHGETHEMPVTGFRGRSERFYSECECSGLVK